MKQKKTKLMHLLTLVAASAITVGSSGMVAFAEDNSETTYLDDVTIAVDEDFGDGNILRQTTESNSSLWI